MKLSDLKHYLSEYDNDAEVTFYFLKNDTFGEKVDDFSIYNLRFACERARRGLCCKKNGIYNLCLRVSVPAGAFFLFFWYLHLLFCV